MKTTQVLEIPSMIPGIADYRIVFEKQKGSPAKENLPKAEQELLENLYDKIQEDPEKHCTELLQLYEQQTHVPEIANLLAFVYLKINKPRQAEDLITKTYEQHPDNLIAKINYADQCLRKKQSNLIPQIFNGIFELNALYPENSNFYYAEFRGFQVVMGFYHLEIGNKQKAEDCYQLAFQVDPLHPSVTALEKRLLKISFAKKIMQALQKLAGIWKKP